ncbi:MAG: HDOD domain-containing protein [Deltaproteobacteria bacterium]|nr:HDOD domain-containing protein [Deltaproteobacteria bacterium]
MIRELNDHEVNALHYELLLKDIVATAEKLPPFPDIVWKVMPLIRNMAPIEEIEKVIRFDQVITARVLTLSQSAYYGRRSKISSLQDAILVLGGQRLVQVIMIACAARYFQGSVSGYNLNERELWEHSVATALVSEKLARRLRLKKALTIYTASLLHDIGKTVLDLYAKIYLHSSLSEITNDGIDLIDMERKALGIGHQELGELIARRWQFPPEVVLAIGHHHSPDKSPSDKDIVTAVYISNAIVNGAKRDENGHESVRLDEDPYFIRMGVDRAMVDRFHGELEKDMEEIRLFLRG